jgi:exodeoxyribonuclease V beta subunit
MSAATDWRDAALQGRLLVEASAGTGKTWTIAALYLRLLLEGEAGGARLLPARIVVATFTDAAAQELGERLRARVTQALQAAQRAVDDQINGDDGDPVRGWLAARWQETAQRTKDRAHLLAALAQLDRAPIGTLHGLCHRLLLEHPLEGALGFAPPALGDGRRVHEAIARDLLRRIGAGDAPARALELPARAMRFDELVDLVGFVLQPGAVVTPAPDEAALRAALVGGTEAVLRELSEVSGHYGHSNNAILNTVKKALEFLDGGPLPMSKGLSPLLDPAEIDKPRVLPAARAKVLTPEFQTAIGAFETLRERLVSPDRAFWAHWAPELRRLRDARSAELGELGFDPLIERVRDAMLREGSALPAAAFARWPVALVDEFQDTDGTQYALLDRWFRADDGAPRGLLAMVGDPKQAIYGFRGGDVQAYLRARAQAPEALRLGVNQRSSTAYVEACNALFDGPRAALSVDATHAIRYAPVQAAGRADAARLHERGVPVARPLVVHAHPFPEPNARVRPRAIEACADLVVELLAPGRFTLGAGGPALAPGDLAVLLRTNAEIDDLRRALQRRRVPCAGQSRQEVFDGATARNLLLVLHALQHPAETSALRAALLTPLFGVAPTGLQALEEDGGLDIWRERFFGWRQRWRAEGVLAAILGVLEAARTALADDREGERIATDLRHLGELLQTRESEGHAPGALLDWLRAQRRGDDDGSAPAGERSLRLESDARRVRLMTLHGSKGLEFPVVLLPTLWGHEARRSERALAAADDAGRREAVFESAGLEALKKAEQDERFRLLYVALTRAVQACHLFVLPHDRPARKGATGPKADPERSALDALLARWPEGERDAPGIAWRPHWPLPPDVPFDPAAQAGRPHSGPDATTPPAAPGPFLLPTRWSFSRLAGGAERRALESAPADDEAAPDPAIVGVVDSIDADDEASARIGRELGLLADVGGKDFGNALHALLENMTPGQPFATRVDAVQAALARHAVRSSAHAPPALVATRVAAMLDRALSAEMRLPDHAGTLRLGELPLARRRHELAFHFVLREASLSALRTACAAHGEPRLVPPGNAERLSGWMEGSIDLVFEHGDRAHVLDWKGNALPDAAAAAPDALVARMDQAHYRFQALLYTVALQRLLRQRRGAAYRSAEHLGAPVYLFLRAVGLGPGLGVWSQRFPDALIDAVDRALAGGAA